ncbi:ABC transporter ATP-binding protein [Desulfobacterales bacterium HSG17]|nr:ABC transporter ATP-binding protein [Desulfobacterales bacterium HSG17]
MMYLDRMQQHCWKGFQRKMKILEARQLTKTYTIEDRQITILDNISFTVPAGHFVVIEGPSGSGKSTLLTLLSGLDRPDSGTVLIHDTDITYMNEDELAPLRNETLGFVFQSFHLVPSLTALENVMFPAELKKDKQALEKAEILLKSVGLEQRRLNYPHQLSGGEKQRVAICRAMINDPALIFADEPTGNLDSENSRAILQVLLKLRRERGSTLILVTHSAEIAAMADRKITLKDGRIEGLNQDGQD